MNTLGQPLARTRSRSDGFIIIAVLWIVLALATLTSIYSVYVGNSAVSISVIDDDIQANPLISTSLELTTYALSGKEPHPTTGAFNFRLGRANVAVAFSSEAGRIDLNAAPAELLAGLFTVLGASPQSAQQYADRIIGWRTPPKPQSQDQDLEDSLYLAAGLPYLPRRGAFTHVEELRLVLGLPPALVDRAMLFVTIFTASKQINILEAAPEIIAALPGMAPGKLNAFLDQRATAPPEFLPGLLGVGGAIASTKGSKAIRVLVRIAFDSGRKMASEVVILTGDPGSSAGTDPYQVLSWRDDIDASSGLR